MEIAISSLSFSNNRILRQELQAHYPHSRFNTTGALLSGPALHHFIGQAHAAIVGTEPIDTVLFEQCPNLTIIAKYGVGLDNIDTEAAKKHNVQIGWTGGVNAQSVAEMTLGFMLSLQRNLYPTAIQLRNGRWHKSGGRQLSGKTIGIIGVGHIGKTLIRLLTPFQCTILVNDIRDQPEYYRTHPVIPVDKPTLYQQADIVTLHVPLTDQTHNMITKTVFDQMKPTAFIINTARGSVINEPDLDHALTKKTIAGAALDVYTTEPVTTSPLWHHPNAFCTPHIGGNAEEAVLAMGRSAMAHLTKI